MYTCMKFFLFFIFECRSYKLYVDHLGCTTCDQCSHPKLARLLLIAGLRRNFVCIYIIFGLLNLWWSDFRYFLGIMFFFATHLDGCGLAGLGDGNVSLYIRGLQKTSPIWYSLTLDLRALLCQFSNYSFYIYIDILFFIF